MQIQALENSRSSLMKKIAENLQNVIKNIGE